MIKEKYVQVNRSQWCRVTGIWGKWGPWGPWGMGSLGTRATWVTGQWSLGSQGSGVIRVCVCVESLGLGVTGVWGHWCQWDPALQVLGPLESGVTGV